ncbi:MAG: MarR family winged helix-turn-helix transcriptional regulator [Hyphomicrobiaceae bacterium]|nr:MarR family winged helix-turn-helix transcriptional regulator [Hyphomicrobiaceae bacterium]
MPDEPGRVYFTLFNEISILAQLSRAMLEARLPPGMLVSHFGVLNHLTRVQDGRTPLDLARSFQVPKTTMTHTLATLEAAGLIETRLNPEDKRSKLVWITAHGRSLRKTAIEALNPDLERLAKQFPLAAVEAILPTLTTLRQVMDADRS